MTTTRTSLTSAHVDRDAHSCKIVLLREEWEWESVVRCCLCIHTTKAKKRNLWNEFFFFDHLWRGQKNLNSWTFIVDFLSCRQRQQQDIFFATASVGFWCLLSFPLCLVSYHCSFLPYYKRLSSRLNFIKSSKWKKNPHKGAARRERKKLIVTLKRNSNNCYSLQLTHYYSYYLWYKEEVIKKHVLIDS